MTARPLAEVLLDLENVRHDLSTAASLNASGQKFDALETFQDVPLRCDGAGSFETAMLRHGLY